MKIKTTTKNKILVILTSIIASVVPALIFDKWVEAVIFLLCHTLIRQQFKDQYHHIIPAVCRIITAAIFFFGICFVLPTELSLISAIPINYLISWVGAVKKQSDVWELQCERQRQKIVQLLEQHEHAKYSPLDLLLEKCAQKHISKRNTEIAVMYYIERKAPKEIWEWLCENNENMELDSVYKLLNRLNKKLK